MNFSLRTHAHEYSHTRHKRYRKPRQHVNWWMRKYTKIFITIQKGKKEILAQIHEILNQAFLKCYKENILVIDKYIMKYKGNILPEIKWPLPLRIDNRGTIPILRFCQSGVGVPLQRSENKWAWTQVWFPTKCYWQVQLTLADFLDELFLYFQKRSYKDRYWSTRHAWDISK